ncbi:MAG: tetratricopeptide repeat protein [Planctomycetota bacterium]
MQAKRWKLALYAAAFSAWLLAPHFAAARDGETDPATQMLYAANGLLNRGHNDLALAEYARFIDDFPNHDSADLARYGMAVAQFRLRDFDAAAVSLEQLSGRSGFTYGAEVSCMLGRARAGTGDQEKAITAFRRVLDVYPKHELADDASSGLIESLYATGAYQDAGEQCAAFVSAWPESKLRIRAEFYGGRAAMNLKDYKAGAKRFRSVVEREDKGVFADQARLYFARCLHLGDQPAKAVRAYRQGIDDSSDEVVPDLMLGLATLLRQQKSFEEAEGVISTLLKRFPDTTLSVRAHYELGHVLFALERYDDARPAFEAAAASKFDFADDAAYWAAKCAIKTGKYDSAAEMLGNASTTFDSSDLRPQMSYDRAVALIRSDDFAAAETELRALRKKYPSHPLAEKALYVLASQSHVAGLYGNSGAYCRMYREDFADGKYAESVGFMRAENLFLEEKFKKAARAYAGFLERHPYSDQAKKARYRRGIALFSLERVDDALPILKSVVDRGWDEEFAGAWLALGDIRFQRGEWKRATVHLQEYLASRTGKDADDAWLKLGIAQQRSQSFEDALQSFGTLIDRFPHSAHRVRAIFERGQVLATMGRAQEARQDFESVVTMDPGGQFTAYALNHLGNQALADADSEKAADYFAKAAARDEKGQLQAGARFQQGRALFAAGKYRQAIAVLKRYLKEFPKGKHAALACGHLAIASARTEQCDDAIAYGKQTEKKWNENLSKSLLAAVRYENAWCLRESGQADEAAQLYRKLLATNPPADIQFSATLELADLAERAERFEEAAELLRPMASLIERDNAVDSAGREQVWYRLGICEYRLKKYREASTLLAKVLETGGSPGIIASVAYFHGDALFRLGDFSGAIPSFKLVIDDHPDDPLCEPSMLRLGESLATMQRWTSSERAFAAHRSKFPASSQWYQAQFGIGWAQEHQGRLNDARKSYREVVAKHKGETAGRAQFQIGECLFAEKKFEEAARELLKVDILFGYPEWSAAALFEAGRCFEALGRRVDAQKQYLRVVKKYAGSEWAQLAQQRLDAEPDVTIPGRATRESSGTGR